MLFCGISMKNDGNGLECERYYFDAGVKGFAFIHSVAINDNEIRSEM